MDGFAATRALRNDADTKDIPVILVTAKDQKADKAWGQMLGAKAYITKPYTDDQVLTQVRAI
jgi:twitching motility two-component system response regulator PilH